MPFTSDMLFDEVNTLDDDDLKEWGMYSEENLVEKYRKAAAHVKSASPPIQRGEESEK